MGSRIPPLAACRLCTTATQRPRSTTTPSSPTATVPGVLRWSMRTSPTEAATQNQAGKMNDGRGYPLKKKRKLIFGLHLARRCKCVCSEPILGNFSTSPAASSYNPQEQVSKSATAHVQPSRPLVGSPCHRHHQAPATLGAELTPRAVHHCHSRARSQLPRALRVAVPRWWWWWGWLRRS